MKLILVRHGKTIENEQKVLAGQSHGTLSEEGIRQAELVGQRLKDEKIDAIYSSDLKRASDTASAIVKFHPDVSVVNIVELRERNYGNFTGKSTLDLGIDRNKDHPELEHISSLRLRAKAALDKAYAEHPNDTVVFVAHSRINRALISIIMEIPEEEAWDKVVLQKNTCVNIFEIREDKKHVVHLLNDVEHLKTNETNPAL